MYSGRRRALLVVVVLLATVPTLVVGCRSTGRQGSQTPVKVLRARGAVHVAGHGQTLRWIAADLGYTLQELEALNPRWQGVEIRSGEEIQLPVGKPRIRRVNSRSNGTR